MSVKKINELFYVKVDSNRDLYGANGFQCIVSNDLDNTTFEVTNPFEEIILPHESHSATADGFIPAGVKIITVTDNTLVSGDVFDSGDGNMYYIKEVVGNQLFLFIKTLSDIPSATILNQVGNTGIYRVAVTITSLGYYTIIILNDSLSVMNREIGIKIIAEDITDAHTKLDNISSKVDTLSADRAYVAFV